MALRPGIGGDAQQRRIAKPAPHSGQHGTDDSDQYAGRGRDGDLREGRLGQRRELEFTATRAIAVNTGTDPAVPPVAGLASSPSWTNRDAVTVETVPESLIVLGGGAVGLDLAQAFARFGSTVHVVEVADANADMRLVANPGPGEAAQAAVLALREQAIVPTLDKTYGSPIEDTLANVLVGVMMAGRSWRSRSCAGLALGLSPYSALVRTVLASLTANPAAEVRRAATLALECFPTSNDVVASLTRTALGDADPDIRGCARRP